MAREYMILRSMSGPISLQITDENKKSEIFQMKAVSDPGIIREAESIIEERYYGSEPGFSGFNWESMGDGWGWRTTDYDLK